MIDFSWPKADLEAKERVISFAQNEIGHQYLENDQHQKFPTDDWKKCAAYGIQQLALPKSLGGKSEEVDFMRALLLMEGFGYGCKDNGLAFALNAQMWTVQTPILHFGSEAQKQKYLIPMGAGDLVGAHALTEPDAGSDVYSMSTTAKKVDGGYVLNGEKHLITLGPICDFVLVFAISNPDRGKWGVSAFIVDADTPGFTRHEKQNKMGMRSIPIGKLEFKDCFIPDEQMLGKEGMGFSVVNLSLEYDKCCILASQLGAMQRQLEQSIQYVKSRKQFGQSVGQFQSVSNRIVDMKLRLETARLLLYKTAWLKSTGQNATIESSLLKLHLSESFLVSSLDAIRNQGGIGYLSDTGIEKDMRDAMGGVIYAGTSDIQRNIVAKMLGL